LAAIRARGSSGLSAGAIVADDRIAVVVTVDAGDSNAAVPVADVIMTIAAIPRRAVRNLSRKC
jgi:hypothetical protein